MALTCLGSAKTPQINLFLKKSLQPFSLYDIFISSQRIVTNSLGKT